MNDQCFCISQTRCDASFTELIKTSPALRPPGFRKQSQNRSFWELLAGQLMIWMIHRVDVFNSRPHWIAGIPEVFRCLPGGGHTHRQGFQSLEQVEGVFVAHG